MPCYHSVTPIRDIPYHEGVSIRLRLLQGIIRRVKEDGPDRGDSVNFDLLSRSVRHRVRDLMDDVRSRFVPFRCLVGLLTVIQNSKSLSKCQLRPAPGQQRRQRARR